MFNIFKNCKSCRSKAWNWLKIRVYKSSVNFDINIKETTRSEIFFKTLGFTYLNAHVYSDTVFFLGNFSKNFLLDEKIYFGIGASTASFIFFFFLGYLSNYLSKYAQKKKIWRLINLFIISFMSLLTIYIIKETLYFFWRLRNRETIMVIVKININN